MNFITIAGQVIIIYFRGSALSTTGLSSAEWAISLGIGAISLPIAVIIRLIPDEFLLA
jgi:P-type Ca2+ transporter type 2C